MARGVFLTNPEVNKDDITVTASAAMGLITAKPIPFDANSGLLDVTAVGWAGDLLPHDVEIFGTQKRPYYAPLTSDGDPLFTDPFTFATMAATLTVSSTDKHAIAACDDQLYKVIATTTGINVYVWTGSAWTLRQGVSGVFTDNSGGVAVAAIQQNLYIAVCSNADAAVILARYNTTSNTIGILDDSLIAMPLDGSDTPFPIESIALATDGASFVLLLCTDESSDSAGRRDVRSFFGHSDSMEESDTTFRSRFNSTWSGGNDFRAAGITWNARMGYVVAVRCGTSTPAKLRIATTNDGDSWQQLKDLNGTVREPGALTTPWADGACCAVAVEELRIYVGRATAATLDGAATDVQLAFFDGIKTWTLETDIDGGVGVASGTQVAATNWRGEIFMGWKSSSTVVTVRRGNSLTASGTLYRELRMGEPMFVAGLDDDSKTALFIIANGSITAGDKYRSPIPDYAYAGINVLDDALARTWRAPHETDQYVILDAGSGLGFAPNAIAVFGTNVPELTLEMDDSPTFASPAVSQSLSAVVQTATALAVDRNRVTFASDTFEDRKFAAGGVSKYWAKFSGGAGAIFRILDNTTDALMLDGSAVGNSGAVSIFRDSMGYFFGSVQGPLRYLRLVAPTLTHPDEYYEIAYVLPGLMFVPGVDYRKEWAVRHAQQGSRIELKGGARFNTRLNVKQRPGWSLKFRHYDFNVRTVANFFARAHGFVRMIAFWPDATALTGQQPDVFPIYFTQDAPETVNIPPDAAELTCVIEGNI